jgi:hypothetical protein
VAARTARITSHAKRVRSRSVAPEELVDQVAMRAVQFHAIEAEPLRLAGGAAEGVDGGLDVGLGHRDAGLPARARDARRTLERLGRPPGAGRTAQRADVPKLRPDPSAGRMHGLDDARPAGQRGLAMEVGYAGVVRRGGPVDDRALGDDEADVVLGASPVVRGDVLSRHAAGGERARHRRHHDAIAQPQAGDLDRFEKTGDASLRALGAVAHRWIPWEARARSAPCRARVFDLSYGARNPK